MKTRPDALITEVRSARMDLSASFGHDLRKLCGYLRTQERKHPKRVLESAEAPALRERPTAYRLRKPRKKNASK